MRHRTPLLAVILLAVASSSSAAQNDLSVGWIARLPRIDYVWGSANPTRDGWPAEGATVTWVANVRWLGGAPIHGVSYRWTIDGVEVKSGKLDFESASLVQTELPWTWTFTRHEIAFEIDSDHAIEEVEERNNKLLVYSNALGVGLYAERSFWDQMGPRVQAAGIGGTTFDDWMQRKVRNFNEMALYAVTDVTPNGVLDRWRIDDIHIVDDGALPLNPPYMEARDWGASAMDISSLYPNVLDHTVDMQWGFPAIATAFYPIESSPAINAWIFMAGDSLVQEWSHARTMIDVYAWDVTPAGDRVNLNPPPPVGNNGNAYYNTPEQGLMHFDWGHIDRYSAAAMNRMTGRRAIKGNYNEPWDLGWFVNDLPAQNHVRFLHRDGTPIAKKKITLHRSTGELVPDSSYAMVFNNTPGTVMTTDASGIVDVGHDPFSDTGVEAADYEANGVVIVEIEDGSTRRWAYLDSLEFNLAYWRGDTDSASYDVIADAIPCGDQFGPSAPTPPPEALVTTRDVRFFFPVTSNTAYRLFYAVDGGAPVSAPIPPAAGTNRTEITLPVPDGRVVWWFTEANAFPPCPAQQSAIYQFDHQYIDGKRRAVRP